MTRVGLTAAEEGSIIDKEFRSWFSAYVSYFKLSKKPWHFVEKITIILTLLYVNNDTG